MNDCAAKIINTSVILFAPSNRIAYAGIVVSSMAAPNLLLMFWFDPCEKINDREQRSWESFKPNNSASEVWTVDSCSSARILRRSDRCFASSGGRLCYGSSHLFAVKHLNSILVCSVNIYISPNVCANDGMERRSAHYASGMIFYYLGENHWILLFQPTIIWL